MLYRYTAAAPMGKFTKKSHIYVCGDEHLIDFILETVFVGLTVKPHVPVPEKRMKLIEKYMGGVGYVVIHWDDVYDKILSYYHFEEDFHAIDAPTYRKWKIEKVLVSS